MNIRFGKHSIIMGLLFCFLCGNLSAQIYLQMEKIKSTKSHKISAGTEITFQLEDRDYYITEKIVDFIPEEGVVSAESGVFFAGKFVSLIPDGGFIRRGRFFIYMF